MKGIDMLIFLSLRGRKIKGERINIYIKNGLMNEVHSLKKKGIKFNVSRICFNAIKKELEVLKSK